jgi:hypothetical protein
MYDIAKQDPSRENPIILNIDFISILQNVKATHPLPGAIFDEGVMG